MACAAFRVLEITDGTVIINLLAETSGFCCTNWDPAIVEGKGGGVWRDSPLSGGRRQVMRKLGNVIERYELQVRDWNPNKLARDTQDLRRLLEKAITYWTSRWQDEPVWIKAQSPHETNPRYALVHDYSTPADKYPYGQPFWPQIAKAAIPDFALLLERGHWTENEPGTGAAVECSAAETYDSRNLGNVDNTGTRDPTTANEVYIANKRNEANITHVHYWDGAGNAWSANLMDAGLPYDLLQNPVAADDVIVFGIDTSLANSGPFCSLVFDIGTIQNDLTITWRYSDAGVDPTAWTALTVQDNTNDDGIMTDEAFNTADVNSVHWAQPNDWQIQNPQVGAGPLLGTTGYWVCAHVTAIGGTPTPPTQQNRDIYSIIWPYIEFASSQIPGDIPALARELVYNQSGNVSLASGFTDRIIMGLRSMSRSSNFTAYINLADEQNPAGITITCHGAGACAFVNDVQAPTGRQITYNPGAQVAWRREAYITLNSTIAVDYYGTYHAFLRCKQIGGAGGDIGARLQIAMPVYQLYAFQSDEDHTATTTDIELLDLGQITIPPTCELTSDDIVYQIILMIQLECSNAAADLYLYDLILIPVDEFALDTSDPCPDTTVYAGLDFANYQDLDSVKTLKRPFRSLARLGIQAGATADEIFMIWPDRRNGPSILQANAQQRLWFLTSYRLSCDPPERPEINQAHSVQVFRNSRYLSLRGDR